MTTLAVLILSLSTLDVPGVAFREDVGITEGTRGLREAFPYLRAKRPGMARGEELTPENLHRFIPPVRDEKAAYAAVRLFVAGIAVEKGDALITVGEELRKEFQHLKPKVDRKASPADWSRRVERKADGWHVTFVAYEMDRLLQLVRIDAVVPESGPISMQRTPIVRGPMTSWQTAMINGQDDGFLRREKEMQAEARDARRRYAEALRMPRTLDAAFAIGRLRLSPAEVRSLWPGKQIDLARGLNHGGYILADGTVVSFAARTVQSPIHTLIHRKNKGPVLHRLTVR
ncbi:MAG: hypothetical protein AAGD14_09295 [Planctomycetota bacterium]